MNTPDAKAGGKGISWETALALSLCQPVPVALPKSWHRSLPANGQHCRNLPPKNHGITEYAELEGMPNDHGVQHQWNPLQAAPVMLLREVGSIQLETPPLSSKFLIHKDPAGCLCEAPL